MITPEGLCAEHDEIKACDSCAENERERIIELLKGEAFTTPRNEVAVSEKLDILIALINGDNNASE